MRKLIFLIVLLLMQFIYGCTEKTQKVSLDVVVKEKIMGRDVCTLKYSIVNDKESDVMDCVVKLEKCNIELQSNGFIGSGKLKSFERMIDCTGCDLNNIKAICETKN